MLSTTTEYALRALVHLARQPEGTSMLGRDLARHAQIPANYLSKILWNLRNAGYVATTRGQRGGYRLSRPPQNIGLIDIVELFEGIRSRPGCLIGEQHECSDLRPCTAHHRWKQVRQSVIAFLESNSVADIA